MAMLNHPMACDNSIQSITCYNIRGDVVNNNHCVSAVLSVFCGALVPQPCTIHGDVIWSRGLVEAVQQKLDTNTGSTPLKNMKVSWDDDITNWMEKKHVPNHQPEYLRNIYRHLLPK